MIRVAIIEDEELARKRVKRLLGTHDDVQLIGEATSGFRGQELIQKHEPDVVLLDIDMPGQSGFEVVAANYRKRPVVIFSTAYPNYALKAFDADAVDYLLKPYDQQRFDQALEKARYAVREWRLADDSSSLHEVEIVEKGVLHRIRMNKVILIEAFGNYLKLHTPSGYFLYRSPMSKMVESLDNRRFIRVHRSYVINVEQIVEIKYMTKGEYKIHLVGGLSISSGRKFQRQIKEYLAIEI